MPVGIQISNELIFGSIIYIFSNKEIFQFINTTL